MNCPMKFSTLLAMAKPIPKNRPNRPNRKLSIALCMRASLSGAKSIAHRLADRALDLAAHRLEGILHKVQPSIPRVVHALEEDVRAHTVPEEVQRLRVLGLDLVRLRPG